MANSFGPGTTDNYKHRILRESSGGTPRLEERVMGSFSLPPSEAWTDLVTWDTSNSYYGAAGEILLGAGDWGCHGGPALSAHFQMSAQQGGQYWDRPGTIQYHYHGSYSSDEIQLRVTNGADVNEVKLQVRIVDTGGNGISCNSSANNVYCYVKILVPNGALTWAD